MHRLTSAREGLDDEHAPTAAGARTRQHAWFVGCCGLASSASKMALPVTFAPGRLRLATRPIATGSPPPAKKALGSKIIYLETLQQFVEQQHEREVQQSRYREAEAAIGTVIESRAQAEAEHSRALSSDLVEAERKAAGLSEDLVKAEQRTKSQFLTAPVDGVVQQVAIHTIGGVVTPAQALLAVVPDESRLDPVSCRHHSRKPPGLGHVPSLMAYNETGPRISRSS
jgi:hypothetical protein